MDKQDLKIRDKSIDIGKGIGILFVLFYHVLYLGSKAFVFEARVIASVILFFFIVSGYTYDPGTKSWRQRMAARVKHILLPTIFCGVLLVIITGAFLLLRSGKNPAEFFGLLSADASAAEKLSPDHPSMMFHVIGAYWFPIMLLAADMLFFAVADHAVKTNLRCSIVCVALFLISGILIKLFGNGPKGIHGILVFAGCMLLGTLLKKLREYIATRISKPIQWLIVSAALAAYIILVIFFDPGSMARSLFGTADSGGIGVLTAVIQGVLFSFVLLFLCDNISRAGSLSDALTRYGRNSLIIMLTHCFIAFILCNLSGVYFHMMSMNALNNGISIDKPPIVTLQTGAVALLTLAVTTLLAFCAEKVKKSSHIS